MMKYYLNITYIARMGIDDNHCPIVIVVKWNGLDRPIAVRLRTKSIIYLCEFFIKATYVNK